MKTLLILFTMLVFTLPAIAQKDLSLTLPDGNQLQTWNDETEYSKTYFVDQVHPKANDANQGIEDQPFLTIQKAADVLQPGEKVIVKSGIYREFVRPARGGKSPGSMICYEVANGAKVIVKGTQKVDTEWTRSIAPNGQEFSFKLSQTKLDQNMFDDDNPFKTQNANKAEMDVMPWAVDWTGHVPYTLPRGLVFQNGKRMLQMVAYVDLIKLPGSYWVAPDGETIHVHPFKGADIASSNFEVTTHQQIFKSKNAGASYIRVNGFIFEQAGNGFPRVGTGAVFVNGGDHWIIENNVVRHCNSVGIEAGAKTMESKVATDEEMKRSNAHTGGFIIRNNEVYDCGTGGIEGHTLLNSLIENNHIHHIGWQDVERYWECAGIKVLLNTNVIARKNKIHHIEGASAIWFDWDNRNSRITQNLIVNVAPNYNGAIFIEASVVPNMIDNNILINNRTIGVILYDTDNTIVAHNLFFNVRQPLSSRVNTDRTLNGKKLTSSDNQFVNNIICNQKESSVIENKQNICDYNMYISANEKTSWVAWQKEGWDRASVLRDMKIMVADNKSTLVFRTSEVIPLFPAVPHCNIDYYGNERKGDNTVIGPFEVVGKGQLMFPLRD